MQLEKRGIRSEYRGRSQSATQLTRKSHHTRRVTGFHNRTIVRDNFVQLVQKVYSVI